MNAPEDLAADVRAGLARLLTVRDAGYRSVVFGAGNDDFEVGRRFLGLLADGGYAVPTWTVEHGGMGLDRTGADTVARVLAEFDTPDMYPYMVGLDLVGPTIVAHGSADQAARWLPAIRDGREIWCQMFSEPDAGSDLANLGARAVRDGDAWRITGSKVWTSRAHYARWGLLLARTDPSLPKHAGITAFGLDLESPGVRVRPLVQMNRDAHFNEVFLDDVVVPDSDRIGAVGEGWRVAITCLSFERGSLAGGAGVDEARLLGVARPPVATPERFGAVARDRLVSRLAELRIGHWTAERAKVAVASGRPPGPEGSGLKLSSNRTVKDLASLALEVEGPAATVTGAEPDPWQTVFLVSPSLSIRGGTDEIQHNIVGERVLGLPPEPRVDKNRPYNERPGAHA